MASARQLRCDIRYVNFKDLVARWGGEFDVIISDPPLRIRGGDEGPETGSMLSNALYAHKYRTMSLTEHIDLKVEDLSNRGFFFLWTLKSLEDYGRKCLRKFGYRYLRTMEWIKTLPKSGRIHNGHGYYFQHAHEVLLVGCKGLSETDVFSCFSKVSTDIFFGPALEASAKPPVLHEIIEEMFPRARKLELFARTTRKGWFAIGDQLSLWTQVYSCDTCGGAIGMDDIRYKKKDGSPLDLCASCFHNEGFQWPKDDRHFFRIENIGGEDAVVHEYISCDCCGVEPIQGVRFRCNDCEEYDLCEDCFDHRATLKEESITEHEPAHLFTAHPKASPPYTVHDGFRCSACRLHPITGVRIECLLCGKDKNGGGAKVNLCQTCFFLGRLPLSHKADHPLRIRDDIDDASLALQKRRQCQRCRAYMFIDEHDTIVCDTCPALYFCLQCFDEANERNEIVSFLPQCHTKAHRFFRQHRFGGSSHERTYTKRIRLSKS